MNNLSLCISCYFFEWFKFSNYIKKDISCCSELYLKKEILSLIHTCKIENMSLIIKNENSKRKKKQSKNKIQRQKNNACVCN